MNKICYLKVSITIFFVMLMSFMKGAPVDTNTVKTVAAAFWAALSDIPEQTRNTVPQISYTESYSVTDNINGKLTKSVNPCFYVVNFGDDGFVLVSADDRTMPVLGFSTEGKFSVEEIQDNMSHFFLSYKEELEYVVENDVQASPENSSLWDKFRIPLRDNYLYRANVIVPPLIKTTWNQSPIYNNMCPYISSKSCRVYTGCVATAMAQIIRYWEWPAKGTGSHSYYAVLSDDNSTQIGTLTADFGNTTYLYDLMPTSINNSSNQYFKNAVAQLSYQCGVSVDMQYGCNGSGAYPEDIPYAMRTYFDYKCDGIYYLQSPITLAKWQQLLKNDLDAGRPVAYGGNSNSGGHAFICDGYRDDNYFHFNWGWGGANNGYYTISTTGTGADDIEYWKYQDAILGLEPNRKECGTSCSLTIELSNSAGQKGWNGAYITVFQGNKAIKAVTLPPTATSVTHKIDVCEDSLHFEWTSGSYDSRCSFTIKDADNNVIFSAKGNNVNARFFSTNYSCTDCPYPINLSASNIGIDSVTISWTSGGSPIGYNVEYGLQGFPHGNGTLLTNVTPPLKIQNLISDYDYEVYVQAVCADSATSAWSSPCKFTTLVQCSQDNDDEYSIDVMQWISPYLPINYSNPNYPYSYCQELYPRQLLQAAGIEAGIIHSISFATYNMPLETINDVHIYLGHTDEESFQSGLIYHNNLTEVYSGNWTFTDQGQLVWSTINLQKPFKYDGKSNLVVAMLNNSGNILSDGYFTSFTYDTNYTYYISTIRQNSFSPADLATTAYNFYASDLNDIKFGICSSCQSSYSFIDTTADNFPFSINGLNFTNADKKTVTISNSIGCDSVITINVRKSIITTEFSETRCDSFVWNDSTYFTSGDYTQHFNTVNGCDSAVTLHLTINNSVETEFTETRCDSFVWNDSTYFTSGNYTQHFSTVNGCDSAVTLHLTINNSVETSFAETRCDSFVWNDSTYFTSGDYTQHFSTVNGCDSTVTLHLTINNSVETEFAETHCDSFVWNDSTYFISGDYTQHFSTVNGCDSAVTLHLTINNSVETEFTETRCDSFVCKDSIYFTSGNYTQQFSTVNCCDSAVTLH
ncbi:MAG: C10 family peptidase, partial [Bacteroidales bacterium]|nr:C10 family peptidase [Bacteroidales bacterium]